MASGGTSCSPFRQAAPAASPTIRKRAAAAAATSDDAATAIDSAKNGPHRAPDDLRVVRVDTQAPKHHAAAPERVGRAEQRARICGIVYVGQHQEQRPVAQGSVAGRSRIGATATTPLGVRRSEMLRGAALVDDEDAGALRSSSRTGGVESYAGAVQ